MKSLQHSIKVIVRPGEESGYIAECVEIAVVTQGGTLDEAIRNLQEAVALHLEGEDLADLGFAKNPTLVVTMMLRGRPSRPRRFPALDASGVTLAQATAAEDSALAEIASSRKAGRLQTFNGKL